MRAPQPLPILLSGPRAARMLDISPSTFRRAVAGALLRPVRLTATGHPRYRVADLVKLSDRIATLNQEIA